MRVLSFDLSSVCIGVFYADINDKKLEVSSCPIIPSPLSYSDFGYIKKTFINKNGEKMSAYLKDGEKSVSKAEKKKRDTFVRRKRNENILAQISSMLSQVISSKKPDLILVEKNAIFNGILTTVLLAEIMGVLLGIAGSYQIPVELYRVSEVRSILNTTELVRKMNTELTLKEIENIPDKTKRAIRLYLEKEYDINFLTDDESDACAVFNYWYKEKYLA